MTSCCTSSIFKVSKGVASHWSTNPCHSCRDSHKRHLSVKSFSTSVTSDCKEEAWGLDWSGLLSIASLLTNTTIEGTLITLLYASIQQMCCGARSAGMQECRNTKQLKMKPDITALLMVQINSRQSPQPCLTIFQKSYHKKY